jgi:hypothetical protein
MTRVAHFDGGIIEEGSEGEEYLDEVEPDNLPRNSALFFSPFDRTQAFSHFTFTASGKRRLVCDLQGVYDKASNVFMFSDLPYIPTLRTNA